MNLRWLFRLSILAAAPLQLQLVSAYVTSPNAVPVNLQIKYLKQLTTKLVQAPEGELSDSQVATSHDLMYAWSHLPPPAPASAPSRHPNSNQQQQQQDCAALQVESLLKRLIDERRAGNLDADLTVNDYNCLLEGWARSNLGEASAQRTEQILEGMQQHEHAPTPNLASFKACLMAWRHSGVDYAPIRAQRILEWMIRLHNTGENVQALPDQDCFDMVMQLWSRSRDPKAPQQTEQLLSVMEGLHRSTGLSQLKPRKTTFNAVLAAHSKSSHPQSVTRAADILALMELLAETDPSVAPDTATYNTIMNGYARNSHRMDPVPAAKQADAFLRHVVDVCKKQQQQQQEQQAVGNLVSNKNKNKEINASRPRIQPDTILFNTAIGLWAKTGRPGSFRKARSILDRQLDLALRYEEGGRGGGNDAVFPDVVGVTSVLQSCASETQDKARAWDVALATYRQLQNDKIGCRANHVTYGTMIKACGRLLPKEARRKWLRVIFQDAIQAGSVGEMVVSKLREAATPDLYRELMQGHSKKQLPAEWTCHVQEQSEYRSHPLGNKKQQHKGKSNRQHAKRAEV